MAHRTFSFVHSLMQSGDKYQLWNETHPSLTWHSGLFQSCYGQRSGNIGLTYLLSAVIARYWSTDPMVTTSLSPRKMTPQVPTMASFWAMTISSRMLNFQNSFNVGKGRVRGVNCKQNPYNILHHTQIMLRQHTLGVVGYVIWVLFTIYSSFQQWKNFDNWLGFDKVIAISWWSTFWDIV